MLRKLKRVVSRSQSVEPAQVDSRDYDETGVDIVEALELVSAATDNDASKDFKEKEISLLDDNRLLAIKENYIEEEAQDDKNVLTEKLLVRNIKSALKTEGLRHLSKPVRKISTTAFRVQQLSSSKRRAILRGACRARRQLENVSYCFGQPATKISDPIKNQIEADLELSEEYTTNGRSRPVFSTRCRGEVRGRPIIDPFCAWKRPILLP